MADSKNKIFKITVIALLAVIAVAVVFIAVKDVDFEEAYSKTPWEQKKREQQVTETLRAIVENSDHSEIQSGVYTDLESEEVTGPDLEEFSEKSK